MNRTSPINLMLWPVFVFLLGLSLVSCSPQSQPPHTTQSPPLYPNAHQVTVQNITGSMDPVQVTTFVTNDNSEAIFNFYTKALLSDKWQLRDHLSTPSERHFGWVTSDARTSAYAMTIYARLSPTGQTDVEIRLRTQKNK